MNGRKTEKVQTNFRLPVGILERLDAYAKKEYQDRTSAVVQILNRELPKVEEPKGEQTE